MNPSESVFQSLHQYRDQLVDILPELASYRLPVPPIIDQDAPEDSPIQPLYIPGLKKLEASVRKEIEWLNKTLTAPRPENLPSSNAPHLLALHKSLATAPHPVVAVNQSFVASEPAVFTKPGSLKKKTKIDTKVHVLADGGKLWIKVLAMVNSRLVFELVEQDSYDNSDSSFSDDSDSSIVSQDANPNHLRTSLHKTARFMLRAANLLNPPPKVQLQLPRLQPGGPGDDGRVLRTIQEIRSLGVSVLHGSPSPITTSSPSAPYSIINPPPSVPLTPTLNLNLDLSLLLALVSAICHVPLPANRQAEGVFKPLVRQYCKDGSLKKPEDMDKALLGGSSNARALTIQLESELKNPMIEELVQLVSSTFESGAKVKCWTTIEARDRLGGICAKLAGKDETDRTQNMFFWPDRSEEDNAKRALSFWDQSRYKDQVGSIHLALSSVHLHPQESVSVPKSIADPVGSTCTALSDFSLQPSLPPFSTLTPTLLALLDPADKTLKPSASLTPHTLESLLFGAHRRMTTVTTNRSSLRSLWSLLEDPSLGTSPRVSTEDGDWETGKGEAFAWVLEPRSLAENMKLESELVEGSI